MYNERKRVVKKPPQKTKPPVSPKKAGRQKVPHKKKRKPLNQAKRSRKTIFRRLILLLPLIFCLVLLALSQQGKWQFLRVKTDSMMTYGSNRQPDRFARGDLLVVYQVPVEKLKKGMIVSYVVNQQGAILTHRLVAIERTKTNKVALLQTQGDTNQLPDKGFAPEAYLGKVLFHVPYLGAASQFFSGVWVRFGLILLGSLMVLGIGIKEVRERWRRKQRKIARERRKASRTKRLRKSNDSKKTLF